VHALRSIVVGLLVVWAFEVAAIAGIALIGAMKSRMRSNSVRVEAITARLLSLRNRVAQAVPGDHTRGVLDGRTD
jgi:hypothetical protein